MEIYIDGSARGNGTNHSEGGFGVIVLNKEGQVIEAISRQYKGVTNNRMELAAAIYVMGKYGKFNPTVYCDSAYTINCLSIWLFNWQQNNWLKSDNKPPENLDIMKEFYQLYQKGYRINFQKVKGHNKNIGNEIVDKLATNKITTEEVLRKYGKK